MYHMSEEYTVEVILVNEEIVKQLRVLALFSRVHVHEAI